MKLPVKLSFKLPKPPKLASLNLSLLLQCVIGVLALWSVAMVSLVVMSGDKETAEAVNLGKRYIAYVSDGRVEGRMSEIKNSGASAAEKALGAAPVIIDDQTTDDLPELTQLKPSENQPAEPNELFQEKSAMGILPTISPDKRKPWVFYSKYYKRPDEKPLIALIVTGLGHNRKVTESALLINENITLSFSPYARGIANWVKGARTTGHEIWLDLPMQTQNFPMTDPGPNALLLAQTVEQNKTHLHWAMSRFMGYSGAITPPREVLSNDAENYKALLKELSTRGILAASSQEIVAKATKEWLAQNKQEMLTSDAWIDEELTEEAIQTRLATLEQTALRNGTAVGIATAYPITLQQLQIWQEKLAERGINLVPASFIGKLKFN